MRQIVQALLILCRLHRLADLVQRLYEFCQDRWPQDWFNQFGDRIADLVAWFDQLSGPPLP